MIGLNKVTVYHCYASKSLILFDKYRQLYEGPQAALPAGPSREARYTICCSTAYAGSRAIRSVRLCISRSSRTSPNSSLPNESPRSVERKCSYTSACLA